jgi:hypothetical protein
MAPLREHRCPGCKRLLCKAAPDPKGQRPVEIKCHACNTVVTL